MKWAWKICEDKRFALPVREIFQPGGHSLFAGELSWFIV